MSRTPGTRGRPRRWRGLLLRELAQVRAPHLDRDRRRVAVGEDAGHQAAGPLRELHPGYLRVRISRVWSAISLWSAVRCSGSASCSRMNPMCGPAFGFPIALRAAFGAPTLASTSSTAPFGSSARRTSPISSILRARLLQRGTGCQPDINPLHRLIDLGEEGARQAAGRDTSAGDDQATPPTSHQRYGSAARSARA